MKAKIKAMMPGWLLGSVRFTKRVLFAPYRIGKQKIGKAVANRRLVNRFRETYVNYGKTGVVPPDAYQLLTPVYVLTNGSLTETLSDALSNQIPPVKVSDTSAGVLPKLSPEEFNTVVSDLRRDGIHVLKHRLAPEVCDALLNYAKTTPCSPKGDHLTPNQPAVPFDPANPIGPTYWFDQQHMAEMPLFQQFLTDPTGLRLAQAYLGMEPILNIHMMWWSTVFKTAPDAKSAQAFHFDLDRSKFMKIFVYVTDVSERTGPHVYVRGTHHRKVKPLLQPRRLSDDEMFAHYPKENALTVTGPRGTIILADTRGFHKGQPVLEGSRLMFEVEYVCDRFGRSEPVITLNQKFDDNFRNFSREHPRLFCRFTEDGTAKTTADLKTI